MNNIELWWLNWYRYQQGEISREQGRKNSKQIETVLTDEEIELLHKMIEMANAE
jgi:hypothetical protein